MTTPLTEETLTALLAGEFDGNWLDDLVESASDASAGICLNCHAIRYLYKPSDRELPCPECGENEMYGVYAAAYDSALKGEPT